MLVYLPGGRSRTGRKKSHGKKNTERVTLVEPCLKNIVRSAASFSHSIITIEASKF